MKKLLLIIIPFVYLLLLLFQKDLAMIGDLGRHLKLGEIIINCRCIPQTNLFSYTHPNFPIVNHEWLTEVIFYSIFSWFGLHGLLILKMVLVIITASLLYLVALKKGSLFWVTVFSFLSITIFSTRFHVLPELFSYLFMSLFIFLIERYKQSRRIIMLWPLPLLGLFWVNMHIYFIIGIGIYGLFILEEFIKAKKFDKKLLAVGTVLILSTFLNPSFVRGAILPFTVFNNYGLSVVENKSIFKIFAPTSTNSNITYTLKLQVLVFEFLVILFTILLFFKHFWKRVFHLGNGLFAAILGIRFVRSISVFGVLGFIPLVQSFTQLEEKLRKNRSDLMDTIRGLFVMVISIIIIIHSVGLLEYQILSFSFVSYSEKAVEFIKQSGLRGSIFNNYRIGNQLIYGLYPQEKVFVDARPEAYPASFFDDYWRMMADEKFFNQEVEKYKINAVVFRVDDDPLKIIPFLLRLVNSKDWIPIYADGLVSIIARDNEINKEVIEKYEITLPANEVQNVQNNR